MHREKTYSWGFAPFQEAHETPLFLLLVVHYKNSTVRLRGVLHLKVVETVEFLNNTSQTSYVNEVFLYIHTLNFPCQTWELKGSHSVWVREGKGQVQGIFFISFTCHNLWPGKENAKILSNGEQEGVPLSSGAGVDSQIYFCSNNQYMKQLSSLQLQDRWCTT